MLWAIFCVLVGWAAGVVLLYGIGLVVDPLVVATLGYFGWRWRLIPEGMLRFGAGVSLGGCAGAAVNGVARLSRSASGSASPYLTIG